MKKIYVKNHDLGFFTAKPITVQRFNNIDGEQELVYCNHASSEIVEKETWPTIYSDQVMIFKTEVCDKTNCGAYRLEGDNYWEDSPIEGVHSDD